MSELVSCILATRDRRDFFAQALRGYRSQTWRERELIVIDDGDDPVGDLCAGVDGVRYLRLDAETATGSKLNLGIENARGAILQKIDDDDYYAPEFLATAAGSLLAAADWRASVVGWDSCLVLLAGDPVLRFSGTGWFCGGTLCFSREVWEETAFCDIPVDEDYWFLEHHQGPKVRVGETEQYILVRHGRNTWSEFYTEDRLNVNDYIRSLQPYPKPIGEIADPASAEFYAALQMRCEARP